MITDKEIQEVYRDDTIGRKYHKPIVTKNRPMRVNGENGEITTLILDEPMEWKDFKRLSDTNKTSYLAYLVKNYNAGTNEIVGMLGCARSTFWTQVTKPLALGSLFNRGHQMTFEERLAWHKFCGIIDDSENVQEDKVESPTNSPMEVVNSSFTLRGRFDFIKLTDLISSLVNEGDDCVVTISISANEQE